MMKHILPALYLAATLLCCSYGDELLLNGDFQIGVPEDDKPASFESKWWRRELWADDALNCWLTDGTLDWKIGAGNQALQFRWGACSIVQPFRAAPGSNYVFSIDFFNAGTTDNRWQPRIQVEWFDATDTRIGGTVTVAEADIPNDPAGVWTTLSGNADAPAETAYARVMLDVNNRGDGNYWQAMYLDNASVTGVPGIGNLPCSFISAPYDLTLEPINESTPYSDSLTNYADDKDGDTLTFTTVSKPAWLTIATNGVMSGLPQFTDAGNNEITVTVDDGQSHSDTRTLTLPVTGYLRTANIFDDDMVLQRGKPIPVWGQAVSNTPVTVTMSTGESAATTSDANGDWEVTLPAMPATTAGPVTMTITSGTRTMQVTHLLVGDVWFCSGQSNMDWGLLNTQDSAAEIASANYPNLRYCGTPQTSDTTPWDELGARVNWQQTTSDVVKDFSAVAYYFGKNLQQHTGIPIGLIKSAQGGTTIEKWAVNLTAPGTDTFYNSRVHPYTRMPISGAIWYQAEANVADGSAYTAKMQTLASDWRGVWNQGNPATGAGQAFPFYFVQLASYDYPSHDSHVLPEMWAAQTAAMDSITNSGMAVITDVSDITNIHPQNKAPVGERLARWARHEIYGETNLVHAGPMATSAARESGAIRVLFEHTGSGLVSRDGQPLDWFEVAAADQVYTSATAVVDGDTVVVSHPSVSNPKWVRFAWNEIAEPNLMNAEGLPANAFTMSATGTVANLQDVLVNGDFETGTVEGWMPTNFDLPPWQRDIGTYGDIRNAWLTDDSYYPVVGSSNNTLIVRWANTHAYQDFAATAGEEHFFSAHALSSKVSNRWNAVMNVLWLDDTDNPIGAETLLDQLAADAPENTWLPMSGTAVAPAGAAKGRLILTVTDSGSPNAGFVYFDNAAVKVPAQAPAQTYSTEFGWEQFTGTSGASPQSFDITTNGITLRLTVGASTNGVPVNLGNSVFAQSLGVATGIKTWELDQGSLAFDPLDDESLTFSLEVIEGSEMLDSITFSGINLRLFGTVDKVAFSDPIGNTATNFGSGTAAGANANVAVSNFAGLAALDLDNLSSWRLTVTALDSDATDGTDSNTKATRTNVNSLRFDYTLNVTELPPTANDDSYTTPSGTPLTNAAPGVLANDTDFNGDTLSAIQVTSPTNGTLLSFSSDGSFIYQPDPGFTGTDTFIYQATDGGRTSGVATVTLNVSGIPITLPHILQSNMVLQRNKPIPVWGWGAAGDTVTVSLSSGQNEVTTVDAQGRWEVALTGMAATNGPLTLLISTPDSSVTLTNLVVGDVWFCSGQSNAGWALSATDGGAEEAAAANYPSFRLIRVARHKLDAPSDDPVDFEDTLDWDEETGALKDKAGKWFVCNPDKAGYFGAVFYYAGKELHLNLGIPIGIIQSAYAGTPMEAWANTPLPEAHPPGSDPADPHTLWNGMVYPYLRIPITGAGWYQGERNHDDGGHIYAEKLPVMISDWRSGFAQGDFPFYYIQIPPVFQWNTEAEADPMLPYFWEAQAMVQDATTNTYMVVASDTTSGALHPKNKRPVGERMGLRVLKNTYGFSSIQDQGPVFTHAVNEGSQLRLYFDETGGGLALNTNIGFNANGDLEIDINEAIAGEDYDKDGKIDQWGEDLNTNGVLDTGEDIDGDGILDLSEYDINFPYLTWFEICGAEGAFTNATATINGDTIVVSAPPIPNPVGVRYAWSRFAIGNLMNAEGLPARMFRQTPLFVKDESYSTVQENALYIAPAGILNNDQPASTLRPIERPIVVTHTANGALTVRSDGAFIYSPNAGFTGTDSFAYVATDGEETSSPASVQLNVLPAGSEKGNITREVWTDVSGYRLTDLLEHPAYPESPDLVETLSSLDAPRDWDNSYGQRIHGYLHAPTNGNYTFWIASAARSKLFLSTDTDPSNAVEICECPVSNDGDPENWTRKAAQQSDPIALVGGQKYYIQILHKDAASIDNCSVAWDLVPGETNIVDGAYLSPYLAAAPVVTNYAGWCDWFGVSGNEHLLDFAFNLDPTFDDAQGLPEWEMSSSDGLTVEYQRRKNVPGLSYTVQFTDNLQSNWVDSTASKSVLPVNDIWEHVTVEDETDPASATNRFGRVIVDKERL